MDVIVDLFSIVPGPLRPLSIASGPQHGHSTGSDMTQLPDMHRLIFGSILGSMRQPADGGERPAPGWGHFFPYLELPVAWGRPAYISQTHQCTLWIALAPTRV